jgi:thiamine-monophosphate kinase
MTRLSGTGDVTVADLGERAIIDRIRSRLPAFPPWVHVGPGDDAAVLEPERNRLDVLTTDALVEGVHFDRQFVPPGAVGHKALAVNLSDLAAMGATPRAALLSLALPDSTPSVELDALLDEMLALALRFQVQLIGGNITRSPGPLFVDLTCTGWVGRRRVLTRSGARPGDELYLSGSIGGAAAGLEALREGAVNPVPAGGGHDEEDAETGALRDCAARFLRPEPRVRLGMLVGRNRAATAAMDLSDGLADAVRQVAAASGVGVVIDGGAVPVEEAARRWLEKRHGDGLSAALAGGEDYELLFAVPPRRRRRFASVCRLVRGIAVTRIGVVTSGDALVLRRNGREEDLPEGFVHFG